jgi:hypothetical protein
MAANWRDGLLVAWLVACLIVLAQVGGHADGADNDERAQQGEARDVPMDKLRRRVEEGRLSRHRARWVQTLDKPGPQRATPAPLPTPLRHLLK